MFCVVEVFEEISRKCRGLSEDMSRCEWSVYVDVLDESYPAMQEELARMRELFWNSSRIGTQVMLYSDPYPREYKYHRVNGELYTKPEYTELYDPVQECWKKLKSRISRETLIPIFRELSIDEIFKPHLIYASMAYQWGKSIMLDNECIASEAFKTASSLFDKCIGMVWFKIYTDKQNKLSRVRVNAGKKGGESKAEIYRIIQDKLVELIYQSAPENGWKSKVAAVNDLIEPLWLFIKESQFIVKGQSKKYRITVMDKDSLVDTILKQWALKVESIQLAFDATVRRKKRSKE
ncbi:TPA: hypothetical protein ACPZFO_002903 [Yersinia enterocolitica]